MGRCQCRMCGATVARIVGASEKPAGPLHQAVTFNGWTLGPIAGRLVAEAVRGGKGAAAAFSPNRF